MRQVAVMLESEADAWFERNRGKLGLTDPVTDLIEEIGIKPGCAIEVGCANGWRLGKWKKHFDTRGLGIDASLTAVRAGNVNGRSLRWGSADCLGAQSNWADVLVYGFCLYLTDPEDWLRIAAEGDRVLGSGGHLIIHDFAGTSVVRTQAYIHDERLLSYHFDFAQLWLAHPRYSVVRRLYCGDDEMVTVLKKNGMRAEIMT
jgi:hypothetical protein